jgi:hypothetical protein
MAESITFKDESSNPVYELTSDEEWLTLYDGLIKRIMLTGHAYSADGSLEYTQTELPQLEMLKQKYEDRVLLWRGVTGSNVIK